MTRRHLRARRQRRSAGWRRGVATRETIDTSEKVNELLERNLEGDITEWCRARLMECITTNDDRLEKYRAERSEYD